MPGFTDLIVWKEASALAASITEVAGRITGPSAAKIADQLIRAANSIHANIAESYGRGVTRDGRFEESVERRIKPKGRR